MKVKQLDEELIHNANYNSMSGTRVDKEWIKSISERYADYI